MAKTKSILRIGCQFGSLCTAQKAYWAENQKYTTNLSGKDGLGWKPSGNNYYSYGFSQGAEGQSYFVGSLGSPAGDLSQSRIDSDGFLIVAAGDIDGDGKPDIIGVDHNNKIYILQDDLTS